MADVFGTIIVYACPACNKVKELAITNMEDQEWALNYNKEGYIYELTCDSCQKTYAETKFQIPSCFQHAFMNVTGNEYHCPCGKKTTKPSLLERCIASHVKPYVCMVCEAQQKPCTHGRIDDTVKHLRHVHPELRGYKLVEGQHFRVEAPNIVEKRANDFLTLKQGSGLPKM